jgi:predicted  nucleic acid-binding Zn-ribbon protein
VDAWALVETMLGQAPLVAVAVIVLYALVQRARGELLREIGRAREELSREVGTVRGELLRAREEFARELARIREELLREVGGVREGLAKTREEFLQKLDGVRGELERRVQAAREELSGEIQKAREDFAREIQRVSDRVSRAREDFARELAKAREDFAREIGSAREGLAREIGGVRAELLKARESLAREIAGLREGLAQLGGRVERVEQSLRAFGSALLDVLSARGALTEAEARILLGHLRHAPPARSRYYTEEARRRLLEIMRAVEEGRYTASDVRELECIAELMDREWQETRRGDLLEYSYMLRMFVAILRGRLRARREWPGRWDLEPPPC